MSAQGSKQPGIKEIADALDISIGTVDRAIHNRSGISRVTRDRVLRKIEELGYRPNLAARHLAGGRPIRIGVALPQRIALFFDDVRRGLFDAARQYEGTGLEVIYRSYPEMGCGEAEAIAELLDISPDGLIMVPSEPKRLSSLFRRASDANIPIVCLASDAPSSGRLTCVAADSETNGSTAAELIGRFLRGPGQVLVVTGHKATYDHARKLAGFQSALSRHFPGVTVAGLIEAHENEDEAYTKVRSALKRWPKVSGVYISTVNSLPVINALDTVLAERPLTVVTTDLFPALAERIRSGTVAASIYQKPLLQGHVALTSLYRYLSTGTCPPPQILLAPEIVLRSNVDVVLSYSGAGTETMSQAISLRIPMS